MENRSEIQIRERQERIERARVWIASKQSYTHKELGEFLGVSKLTARDYCRELRGVKTLVDYRRERRHKAAEANKAGAQLNPLILQLRKNLKEFPAESKTKMADRLKCSVSTVIRLLASEAKDRGFVKGSS